MSGRHSQANLFSPIHLSYLLLCLFHSYLASHNSYSYTLIPSYCSKTNRFVNMLSTMHSQPEIEITSDQKALFCSTTKQKGGVDTLDRMVRSYSTNNTTQRWPLVLFCNVIDVSTIDAFIIWQEINHEHGNIYLRQRRKFLISLGKELCGITEEAQPVAVISATRKRKVTLAGNGASLNKRARCILYDRKKNRKCQSLCCRCGKYVCPEHSDIVCIKSA